MKIYTDATIAKDLLLGCQTYAKTFSESGPTELTVYLENFAAKLLEIYYGYSFINVNYESKNFAGIDLLNKENNHGAQFTIQDNSSAKVINSIKKSIKCDKLTIFFFTNNAVDTVVKHVKEKGEWKDNVEVISLVDIFSLIEQDASKAIQCKELCELWINGDVNNYVDIITRFNNEINKRIEANIRSKKYIPEIYIPETNLKNNCRIFSDPACAINMFLYKISTYYTGYCHELLKDSKVELNDGTIISYKDNCDISDLMSTEYPELNMCELIQRVKNYMLLSENMRNGRKCYDQTGREISYDKKYSHYENGLSFTIKNDIHQYSFCDKKFFFIVKDAGQGKTNFLCNFGENVLIKRKIPAVYLNVNELTKNLLETVKDQLSLVVGKEINTTLQLLKQFCTVTNKNIIICIDGLNEKSDINNFRNEVLELFRFVDVFDFLKIIVTTRNKAYDTYFKDFKMESFGDSITEDIEVDQKPYGRKSDVFEKKIYSKYRKYFNISCYVASDARKKLSNDTLLLRLFSEVYENNASAIINDIFLYDLFGAYIKKRSNQLLKSGKIKRQDDLIDLLNKISAKMLETHNLNEFSYDGFSSDEKDLLDLIVQEDIIIKSSDDNGITLFGNRTSFAFTYDEFRDFLLASIILSLTTKEFEKEIEIICGDTERYDGVLKFLFIFCKTQKDPRLCILTKCSAFNKIYAENIFSIEDQYLEEEDVYRIKNALKNPKNKWVYYHVAKRLDVCQYVNLSVKDIVETYIENFLGDSNWNKIFFEYIDYRREEHGLLPELLRFKFDDTRECELYGILMLLSTITCVSEIKEKYLIWISQKYGKLYEETLNTICLNYKDLFFEVQNMINVEV